MKKTCITHGKLKSAEIIYTTKGLRCRQCVNNWRKEQTALLTGYYIRALASKYYKVPTKKLTKKQLEITYNRVYNFRKKIATYFDNSRRIENVDFNA